MCNARKLKDTYIDWIKEEFIFTDLSNEYVSISTPFIDSMYDNIELFAKLNGDNIYITDMGETIFSLEMQGISFRKNSKAFKLLLATLSDFNISKNESNELFITTSFKNFGSAKLRLLQSIMRLNDIPYLIQNHKSTSFNEIVVQLFQDQEIPYNQETNILANDVYTHFDFAIPSFSKYIKHPKLVRTIARPGDEIQAKAFSFDVQGAQSMGRKEQFILLTDSKNDTKSLDAFHSITANLENTYIADISNTEKTKELLIA